MTKVEEARDLLGKALVRVCEGVSKGMAHNTVTRHFAAFNEAVSAFAQAVRAEALAPREPSPELAEAEKWLRDEAVPEPTWIDLTSARAAAIISEIDRLRCEVDRLEAERDGEATLTVWKAAKTPKAAISGVLLDHHESFPEVAIKFKRAGEEAYEIRLTARKAR